MQTLPANVYSVATVRDIDRRAIIDAGIPGYTLMTRAAAAAASTAMDTFPDAKRWQVVCGAGNNGGDGYVLARLAAKGRHRRVSDCDGRSGQTLRVTRRRRIATTAVEVVTCRAWGGELDPEADLLVDGMLGSGMERDVGGEFAAAVAASIHMRRRCWRWIYRPDSTATRALYWAALFKRT